MKKISFLLLLLAFNSISAQTVSGKLVDHEGKALSEIQVTLYSAPYSYTTVSGSDGSFVFNIITSVESENELPAGYEISSNYPNPFNPTTRINIVLPIAGNVNLEVYNILGQRVIDDINKNLSSGVNNIDVVLDGLPNGIYITKFTIDNKYIVTRKLMLLYGAEHLSQSNNISYSSQNNRLAKTTLSTKLDSIVAASNIIGKKVFTNLPLMTGNTLSLGSLTIERYCQGTPTITYAGKTYNTVQIGTQCWLKENLDVGIMIQGSQNQTDNSLFEKYCYNNDLNNCYEYGGFYQWNEAMAYSTIPGTKGICPDGWHIPSRGELVVLDIIVNGKGNALKAIGQGTGSGAGTNSSGFSALIVGIRHLDGYFYGLGFYASYFWSSTETEPSSNYAFTMALDNDSNAFNLRNDKKDYGFSVRCLKD
jgi:uncharacterized protein (TIGR02145 family)